MVGDGAGAKWLGRAGAGIEIDNNDKQFLLRVQGIGMTVFRDVRV